MSSEYRIEPPMVEVAFQSRDGQRIRCELCPQYCLLGEGDIGVCGGRQVIDGRLIAVNYGRVCSLNLDPIEKKPLYHFYPGSEILSVGPNGCNLSCTWCQNWQISQNTAPTRTVLPHELADMVDAVDGIGVAYTYAEPLIWFEYIRDAGRIIHERGLVNLVMTNGYVNAEPLRAILPYIDAYNVDLKSDDDTCYRKFCGGRLSDVQRSIRMIYDSGKHLEISHLIITGLGDNLSRIERLVDWIASIDLTIPLHLLRYFPSHHYDEPPTEINFMSRAYEAAKSKLEWVYLGESTNRQGRDSICPGCGELLVSRLDNEIEVRKLQRGVCQSCKRELNFRMDE